MLFNSIDFAIFLPIVFFLYWFVVNKNLKIQNGFLLIASYIFYGWWDWRFLSLIAFSSFVDYFVGLGLANTNNGRKRIRLLCLSLFINLGFLGVFKYYDFFIDNFVSTFSFFGHPIHPDRLDIILPVGISFYTFQTLSYSIDVYKRKLEPTENIIAFFAFVSFFPQLVAGPIERASNLLPQFYKHRVFDQEKAVDGIRQILWGLFKKIVIADNCAVFVNSIFADYANQSGSVLFLGLFFFCFQVYGDFSGYSDIAIGTARLFGFNLMRNFAYPYFSRDIGEFWRRWHVSLMSWFRDYIYIPLGGSRGSKWFKFRNAVIVFTISGLWHGAAWHYVLYGTLQAFLFLPLFLGKKNRKYANIVAAGKRLPSFRELVQMVTTFLTVLISFVVFRSETMPDAAQYYIHLFSPSLFSIPAVLPKKVLMFIILMVLLEWVQREKQHALQFSQQASQRILRWSLYYSIIWIILYFGGAQQEFIYFQF